MPERLREIDSRFERQLSGFDDNSANRITFDLGRPSAKLRSAGIGDKPIRLYGNKLKAKMTKHGFSKDEVRGLPKAVRNPVAVFKNLERNGAYSVLTSLRTASGNFLVALDLGKGMDADITIVSSLFGKADASVVEWINKGYLRYVDQKKALDFLHSAAPIAAASENKGLVSATKVVKSFRNNKLSGRNLANSSQ